MNSKLNILADWFRANKLSLNVNKTVYMIFDNNKKPPNIPLQLRIGPENITRVNCTKFLGLHIDQNLKWTEHTKHVKNKLSSSLYAMRAAKNLLSEEQLKTIYTSMFHPYL